MAILFSRKHVLESLSNNVVNLKAWNVIKKKLQQVFSCVYSKIFKSIYFQIICKQLVLPLEVFCIRNLLILAMRMLVWYTRRLYMAAAYLFFNYNCILTYEISFSDTRKLRSVYRSNQLLWKIHEIA